MSQTDSDITSRNIVPGAPQPAAVSPKDDFAIVIGINDYPEFRPLEGAIADATSFTKWLRDGNGGGLSDWPDDPNGRRIWLVTSTAKPEPRPEQKHVDNALADLIRVADANGGGRRLYFYFAGHGARATDAVANVALLLADWSRERARLGLSSERYTDGLREYRLFEEIAVFLDCCRSDVRDDIGQLIGMPSMVTLNPQTRTDKTDVFIAYASRVGQVSFERRHGGPVQGVFTHCLLELLHKGPIAAGIMKDALERDVKRHHTGQRAEVINGFDANAVFGVSPLPELCITFTPGRGPVQLLDGALQVVAEHDPATGPWTRRAMKTGLYKLKDRAGAGRTFDFPEETHVVF